MAGNSYAERRRSNHSREFPRTKYFVRARIRRKVRQLHLMRFGITISSAAAPTLPESRQGDPKQSTPKTQGRPLCGPVKNGQLMAKGEDFRYTGGSLLIILLQYYKRSPQSFLGKKTNYRWSRLKTESEAQRMSVQGEEEKGREP
jgi:hypothetical protein